MSAHRIQPSFRAAALALLLVALLTGTAIAQPSASVSVGGSLDSFASVGVPAEGRHNLLGTANLDHLFSGSRGRAFYDLSAGDYDTPGDWSYLTHRAGVTFRLGGDDSRARKVFFTGSLSARSNGDAWTNAAYAGIGAGVNAELHPETSSTFRAGYRVDFRHFADYGALTQVEQRVFASLLRSAESRTTFIAEAQAGFKSYDGVVTTTETVASQPVTGPTRGLGRGMGPGIRVTETTVYRSNDEQGSAGLLSGLVRVAQSLSDRTGAHLQAQVRRTFGAAPPALVTTPAGFFEDGIYDDPFASDAILLQAGVKRSFANGAELSVSGGWTDKDYTSAVALDADGAPVAGSPRRADRVTTALAALSHPLFASRTGAVALDAELGYRLVRHRSNDAFYNYTSHALVFGVTVGY